MLTDMIDRVAVAEPEQFSLFDQALFSTPYNQGIDDTALYRIAVEVLVRAIKDAMGEITTHPDSGVKEAREWLISPTAALWCDAAGVDDEKLRAWVSAGCPAIEKTERTLK